MGPFCSKGGGFFFNEGGPLTQILGWFCGHCAPVHGPPAVIEGRAKMVRELYLCAIVRLCCARDAHMNNEFIDVMEAPVQDMHYP